MFIASYATYIPNISTTKAENEKKENFSTKKEPFSLQNKAQQAKKTTDTPELVRSITRYPLPWQQKNTKDLKIFKQKKTLQNATHAYKESATPFSSVQKPKKPQQKSLKLQTNQLPKEARIAKEQILKKEMINTYIANDNYYRITAA